MVRQLAGILCCGWAWLGAGQTPSSISPTPARESSDPEARYYRLLTIDVPDEIKLEVGGLAAMEDGDLAIATRRGEIWVMRDDSDTAAHPQFHLFAKGLHEPLGLAWHRGALYTVQRTELTRIRDTDGDRVADEYLTVAKGWGVSGNYHEYAYGPKFDGAGNAWITLNSTLGRKVVDDTSWRGWSLKVNPDGSWQPVSGGMRSPAGLGMNRFDDAFYTDQQGHWIATCFLGHMKPGVFHGHTGAVQSCALPGATFDDPGPIPNETPIPEAAKTVPHMALPAVWFPYRKMGTSSTDVVLDATGGRFGPFENQLFVGEFTLSAVHRVFLEKIDGEYQGACFPFRKGFQCGVIRMAFGADGSMWVGQSNRGWNSVGPRSYGLQRLVWTGQTPFEVKTIHALPRGFRLCFTQPVDAVSAAAPGAYNLESYTYIYHSTYGSPEIDSKRLSVVGVELSDDRRELSLEIKGLREGYVHEFDLKSLRSRTGLPLLHPEAYYTLNRIPSPEVTETGSGAPDVVGQD